MPVLQREGRQSSLTKSGAALRYTRNLILVSWLILALPLSASAQEVAGRVISTVGEVVALRPEDSERVLGRGDEVYVGDRLITAENGRAQIRFIDDGLVDLRPDSAFEVVEYQEADDQQSGSAAMEFTAGALRTITGRIGNRPDDEYDMSTDVASIGIRGTDYSLQLCDFDCAQNGQPEGLYGRVDDGVVAITNQAGTTEFSQNQYFYVESEDLMPQLLPSPPQNILDGSEDGETAEETTDDDAEEDDEATALALSDDDTEEGDDDTDAEAAFGGLADVDTEFEIGEDSLDTEQVSDPDPEPEPETEPDSEPEIEPVTRVMAGSFQYDGEFFGGLIRSGEGYDGDFEISDSDNSIIASAEFANGWVIADTSDGSPLIDNDSKELVDGTEVHWGRWNYGLEIYDPDGEEFTLSSGETGLFFIFSDGVTTPEQLSEIDGTISYSAVNDSVLIDSTKLDLDNWSVNKISTSISFIDNDPKVTKFDLDIENSSNDGHLYELAAEQSDLTIENLLLIDFEFSGEWDYSYFGSHEDDGEITGNFSGQLVGETADGMIFSIDIDRLNSDSELIEEILASGLLEATAD